MSKKITVSFAPGCFDSFDGTQEELDELMSSIQEMFENKTSEEIKEMSNIISLEDLLEEDPELAEEISNELDSIDNRTLN